MGALRVMIGMLTGAVILCGLYSGLDIQYGDKGFYCWSAFCLLITALGGGATRGAVAAALLAGGVMGGLEPFAVLLVSLLASSVLYASMFSPRTDDVQVDRRPYEEEIRELLFQNDPSRLHLVDAELRRYKGREKQLLRKYETEFAPFEHDLRQSAGMGGGGGGGGVTDMHHTENALLRKGVLEQARDEEAKRVQASLEASLQRILSRKAGRR